jgi:hypothetical protein
MINQISKSLLILAVGGLIFTGSAITQTTTTTSTWAPERAWSIPGHPRVSQVNGREANQQGRIANGVKNGSLSRKQTSNLEKR